MKKILSGFFAVSLGCLSLPAFAAGDAVELPEQEWSFDGVFGTYDKASMQRGFQVYQKVCSACHSLDLIAFRNLTDLGYNEDEIKAIAAEYTVEDGPNDEGEMFERAGSASDRFPAPFPNEKAAASANGGKAPPDLSLMAKARVGGPDYLYGLLTGYEDAPADIDVGNLSYNKYFPGHLISMSPPLFGDDVEYGDGTEATVEQMATDVSHFLMWAAEPKLEARKQTGVKVMIFLIIFTLIMYAAKRKAFAKVH
ncbi:cytochrome c1 [Kiloniella laminariae]|uniref:Cytochrome c1 n=1 Tax=Kiloniella laminariae TaxID=454162 RepID=A0ABT4LL65_9PROT|nr:cytochrome c1 [Kiloniella laminariae]MCZ4281853.1 cytochrome c1 [Kiloniella laminariae]